ncbi:hypothetical protein [Massilia niabensis]|uniref:Uncharacterized protein n=1 Tax=Massilia niabensis TaxID=544910 RepID=A0ABW0LDR7_9BURK
MAKSLGYKLYVDIDEPRKLILKMRSGMLRLLTPASSSYET